MQTGTYLRALLGLGIVLTGFVPEVRGQAEPAAFKTYKGSFVTIHTDLPAEEATPLPKRCETAITQLAKTVNKPYPINYEFYAIRDVKNFAGTTTYEKAFDEVRAKRSIVTSAPPLDRSVAPKDRVLVMYCPVLVDMDSDMVVHFATHAYIYAVIFAPRAISRYSWYLEGLAETGRYSSGDPKDTAVNCPPHIMELLKKNEARQTVIGIIDSAFTAENHENDKQAQCWALYHFLSNHTGYSPRLRMIALDQIIGSRKTFDDTFGSQLKEINFEFNLFLRQMEKGYRVDVTSFDFKTKPLDMKADGINVKIDAGKGWQHSRVAVEKGKTYKFSSTGTWKLSKAKDAAALTGKGDEAGKGQLVGTVLFEEGAEYALSPQFDMGDSGTFTPSATGTLYLRCNDSWSEIADNTGSLQIKIQAGQ